MHKSCVMTVKFGRDHFHDGAGARFGAGRDGAWLRAACRDVLGNSSVCRASPAARCIYHIQQILAFALALHLKSKQPNSPTVQVMK